MKKNVIEVLEFTVFVAIVGMILVICADSGLARIGM